MHHGGGGGRGDDVCECEWGAWLLGFLFLGVLTRGAACLQGDGEVSVCIC